VEGVNKVILVGHLGKDAKRAPVGFPLLNFTVAVSERRWTKEGYKASTSWHNVSLRGKRVEPLEKMLKSGVPVYIEGRLVNRNYMTKDGTKRYVTEVEVTGQLLVFPKRGQQASPAAESHQNPTPTKSDNGAKQSDAGKPTAPAPLDDGPAEEEELVDYDDGIPF